MILAVAACGGGGYGGGGSLSGGSMGFCGAYSYGPCITTQPMSVSVAAGQTAAFSVVAAGTGTLTYQWLRDGNVLSGASAASYTTPATTMADSGAQFAVRVSSTYGTVTSSPATLTVM